MHVGRELLPATPSNRGPRGALAARRWPVVGGTHARDDRRGGVVGRRARAPLPRTPRVRRGRSRIRRRVVDPRELRARPGAGSARRSNVLRPGTEPLPPPGLDARVSGPSVRRDSTQDLV